MTMLRVISFFALIILTVAYPWWWTALGAIFLTWYFENFIEVILIGLFMDFLYGVSAPPTAHFFGCATLGTLLLWHAVCLLKQRLILFQ